MSLFSLELQQHAELRDYLNTNRCIVCNTGAHSCSTCNSNDILEFEIKFLQKILLYVTHDYGGDLIWLYLKNSDYRMLAVFSYTRLNMPINVNNLTEDEYVCYIWMNYENVFRYSLSDEPIRRIESRLRYCMELHPDYLFQSAVNNLLQLSRNLNTLNEDLDQDQYLQEEEEEHLPINIIGVDEDDDDEHHALNLLQMNIHIQQLNQLPLDSENEENKFNIDLLSGYIDELPLIVECPVCLENIALENVVKLQCDEKHLYCSNCILEICHANPKCSLCRVPIETITTYSYETLDEIAPYLM